jgi:hypothetical protein
MAAATETTRYSTMSHGGTAVLARDTRIHDPRDNDVCELIDAAGPLALHDLAGGLNVPVSELAGRVRRMVSEGRLRQDEWARFATAA